MKAYVVEQSLLEANVHILLEKAGDAAVYGVVKGNGYGLGLIPMARILWENGVSRFAVTEVAEARALREAGFHRAEILMLRETRLPDELEELLDLGATVTVGNTETAQLIDALAMAEGKSFSCHVKIDTGMGRYGFLPEETDAVAAVYQMPHLAVLGIYTHFFNAFGSEADTRAQFAAFQGVLTALSARGIDPGIRHCCNSSAFLKYPEMHLDAVRLGSAILGRLSFAEKTELQPVGWCQAQVELVRELPKGHTVGYAKGFRAKRPTKIAVCGVGYFHGFGGDPGSDLFRFGDCFRMALHYARAFLTHRAVYVTVNGQKAKVLGHIGMVQTICDVTDIPCQVGDPIRLEIGPLRFKNLDVVYHS